MTARLIITRPGNAGQRFAQAVASALPQPIEVIMSPGLRIEPVAAELPEGSPAGIIFTSAHGVEQAQNVALPTNLPTFCVGRNTTAVAKAAGFAASMAGQNAAELITYIRNKPQVGPLWHIAGRYIRGDIAETLSSAGIPCQHIVTYDQVLCEPSPALLAALQGTGQLVLPVFSPRSALLLRNVVRAASLHVIAISEATSAEAAFLAPDYVTISATPDEAGMLDATLGVLREL